MATISTIGYRRTKYRLPTDHIRAHHGGGSKGVKSKSVQASDQDPVTLGLDVAENLISDVEVDGFFFATSTPLYQYGSVTPTIVEALSLSPDTFTSSFTGTARAGTEALRAAHNFVDAGGGTALVVAAETPTPAPGTEREKTAGAGATAAIVSSNGVGIRPVAARTETRNVTDEWQAPNERHRHMADDRYRREYGFVDTVRTVASGTIEAADWSVEEIDHFVVSQPTPRYVSRAVSEVGINRDAVIAPSFAEENGNLDCASPLAVLAQADIRPDDTVLLIGYGAGIADGIAYVATDSTPEVYRTEPEQVEIDYLDYLNQTGTLTNNQ